MPWDGQQNKKPVTDRLTEGPLLNFVARRSYFSQSAGGQQKPVTDRLTEGPSLNFVARRSYFSQSAGGQQKAGHRPAPCPTKNQTIKLFSALLLNLLSRLGIHIPGVKSTATQNDLLVGIFQRHIIGRLVV